MLTPVIVNGAKGKMGMESIKAISATTDLQLIASLDIEDDLSKVLSENPGAVVVDFTHPSSVFANCMTIIKKGCFGVVGTTGLKEEQIAEIRSECHSRNQGFFIAPNFAIGAVLMMQFATLAARHMERVEIIEYHHTGKADAPSGTAHRTAQLMAEARRAANLPAFEGPDAATNLIPGTRGGNHEGIRIHAVRMPGMLAHQEVLFGTQGQTLTIRHDSLDRSCFMPGVVLACRKVTTLNGLVIGLENILD